MFKNFGYVPDFKNKSLLKDITLKIIGYPYAPRRNEARIVMNLLDPKKDEKILDIGCGDGVWYLNMKNKGYNIIGIDISKRDLSKLKNRFHLMGLSADVLRCDGQNMSFKSQSFDKIFSVCVFEHIPDDNKALRESNRILKPGGSIVISIPRNDFPYLVKLMVTMPREIKNLFGTSLVRQSDNIQEFRINFDNKYVHYRNYDIEYTKKFFDNNGFDIVRIEHTGKFFGAFVLGIIHSIKWFEWRKRIDTDYSFNNEIILGLSFPLFYLLFRLDDILYNRMGCGIIVHAKKR